MPLALPVPSVTADLCLPNHIKPASASLESKTSRSLAKVRKHWQGLRVPALSGDENKTLATNKARQSTRHGTKFPARRQSETCTAPPCCHPTPARSRSLEPSWYQSLGRRHVRPAMRSSGKTWEMQRRHSRFSFNSPWGPTGTGFWTLGNFGGKTSTKQYVTCWSCQINFLPIVTVLRPTVIPIPDPTCGTPGATGCASASFHSSSMPTQPHQTGLTTTRTQDQSISNQGSETLA